ncbi:MAG TPA: DUF2231 domain-containing protein [Usitatibacter sp.]|jgi:uncharacterized membrane protein|nr:DUF2231 domain-containing protein [Usitatibacter sp.]
MKTPASIAGHPIHPMLVPIAIGGFVLSFAADLICLATGNGNPWNMFAYYAMIGGILGALAAAIPGLIDLLSLPAGYTKSVAVKHMSINLLVVAIYVCNAWLRSGNPQSLKLPMLLSLITVLLLLVSGWLGGKMVFEAGVGVDTGKPG